jgi:hypothetical protein
MNSKTLLVSSMLMILVLSMITASVINFTEAKQTKADKKAESAIKKKLDQFTGKNQEYDKLCTILANTTIDSTLQLAYEKNCVILPPPPLCNPNEHLENGVCVPDIIPPVPCQVGQHRENGICVPDIISVGIPALDKTTTLRVAVFADVDSNSGLTTQLDLMNKYQVQALILSGDFNYNSGKVVLDNLVSHGFTKTNTALANGNHDSCNMVSVWLGTNICYGDQQLTDKLMVETIDANSQFDCSGTQFKTVKSDIESSNSLYKLVNIHQPFVTVKNNHHGPNGMFDCYNTVFQANGIDLVSQGHVHNYQKEIVGNVLYGVYGTGTHDSGNGMYSCDAKVDQNGVPALCITGTNGFTILDFKIDSNQKQINGYFVSNSDKIIDKFVN